MCDYSLEIYGSRPAREGERYVTTRFPSGTIGLASPGSPQTAVCVACDSQLAVDGIPAEFGKRFDLGGHAKAVFVRLDSGSYRDGLKFGNGKEVSLQRLPVGISVSVVNALGEPLKTGKQAALV